MELGGGNELFPMRWTAGGASVQGGAGARDQQDGGLVLFRASIALHNAGQVNAALTYLHQHGISHNDVKPENVLRAASPREDECWRLLTSADSADENYRNFNSASVGLCNLKLCDFNSASVGLAESDGKIASAEGTLSFRPPEAFMGEPMNAIQRDLWSLGALLWVGARDENHGMQLDTRTNFIVRQYF